ncbi:hypothetical protein SAMN05216349_13412 [Oribacterium sp. KHPX15]|uniref:hypothetical protein n=1 Tax=Oribacterium sp. KHPX15 TaxID=1855342 RepID=UPI000899FA18|nr:hypothetical protein [Oribacterium sp. KHPX15]SEA83442.1 hypothetical protein SAMN05216349_13412 [Oribacterium sp. KHPX15]
MKNIALGSMASILVDDMIYFSESGFNGFFCYNLRDNTTRHICDFDYVSPTAQTLHRQAFRYGNLIILNPLYDKFLRVYDITSKSMLSFPLLGEDDIQYIYCGIIHDDSVWLVDNKATAICFDLKTFKFSSCLELTNAIADLHEEKITDLFWDENKLFCLTDSFCGFFEIVYEAGAFKSTKYCLDKDYGTLSKVKVINQRYWLLFKNHYYIIEWDGKEYYKSYRLEEDISDMNAYIPYDNFYKVGNEIMVTSYYGKNIFYLKDAIINEIELSNLDKDYKVLNCLSYSPCFGQMHQIEDGYYLIFPNRNNRMIEITAGNHEIRTRVLTYKASSFIRFIADANEKGIVFHENENTGLEDIIAYLVNPEQEC